MDPNRAFIDFETAPIVDGAPPPAPAGVAILLPGMPAKYLAFGHPSGNNVTRDFAGRLIRDVFADHRVVMHNAAFDLVVARHHFGVTPQKGFDDTMLLAYLNNPDIEIGEKVLAENLLSMSPKEEVQLHDWIRANIMKKGRGKPEEWIYAAPGNYVAPYAVGDVVRAQALYNLLRPRVSSAGMDAAYTRELNVITVALEMTKCGVRIDRDRLAAALPQWKQDLEALADQIRTTLNRPGLNLNSGEQLANALERAGMADPKAWERTPTDKRSTTKTTLEKVVKDPALLNLLLKWRKLDKYLSTFIESWLRLPLVDGRLHVTWNSTRTDDRVGTRTGRFSSTPNLQNIPKEPDEGLPNLRDFIIPDHGCVLLDRDYNQQEFRLLANFAGGSLLAAYLDDPKLDMHEYVRDAVGSQLAVSVARKTAKTLNFAIIYGAGAARVASQLNISTDEGLLFKQAYYAALPDVDKLRIKITNQGCLGQPVYTIGGRRYLAEKGNEYKLLNTLIQGSAADQTKVAMIAAHEAGLKIIITVHDEIIVETDQANAVRDMAILKEAMEHNSFGLSLPFPTDGKWSTQSWGRLESTAPQPADESDDHTIQHPLIHHLRSKCTVCAKVIEDVEDTELNVIHSDYADAQARCLACNQNRKGVKTSR
jgi:DNA polymerase-1